MMHTDFTAEQFDCLEYTVSHFQEVARQNRFAENSSIEHDAARCVICHPDLIPQDPFLTYLHVITPSVRVRRPRLDQDLVAEINGDLAMVGDDYRVSLASLEAGEEKALQCWAEWVRTALATGLGLLSIHSPTSLDYDLYEAEERGMGAVVEQRVNEIIEGQRQALGG
jgi:hypothetical protein